MTHYIPDKWLVAVAGTTLFYPCSGSDIAEPIAIFAPFMKDFWFADLDYPAGLRMAPALRETGDLSCSLLDVEIEGEASAEMVWLGNCRFLPPSRRIETYRRRDGSTFRVIRRRGFGEIGLGTEFADGSIGVFFYRGDSLGEGGSGLSFFANKRRRYSPLSDLFSLLSRKLAPPALVVTDGANTPRHGRAPVAKFARTSISSEEAFEQCRGQRYMAGGHSRTCVGYAGQRYGPTLAWAVERP
jgi:hypothetical protein